MPPKSGRCYATVEKQWQRLEPLYLGAFIPSHRLRLIEATRPIRKKIEAMKAVCHSRRSIAGSRGPVISPSEGEQSGTRSPNFFEQAWFSSSDFRMAGARAAGGGLLTVRRAANERRQ